MELFVHMYPWEWDQSVGNSEADRVDAWLEKFEDCGFTAIAVTERPGPDAVWDGSGWSGLPYVMRSRLDGPNDTILKRIQAHSGGFKVLLRQQTAIHRDIAGSIATEYGDGVFGPWIVGDNMRGLNPYDPRSLDLLRDHATRLKNTIYDEVDWVEIGWTSSGECDDVRGFINNLNTPTKTFRSSPEFVTRSGLQRAAVPAPRGIRLDDAHMAMGNLWDAALSVYGTSKPIGLLRGSCWHAQNVRRNLPFFPGETLAQVNDVNQTPNEWCIAAGFGYPYQTNALAFSCDLLRGSGLDLLINEVDGMVGNFRQMDPPADPPHGGPPYPFDQAIFQGATQSRATLCFSRGVSFMFTHFRYSQFSNIPLDERNPPFMENWQDTANTITDHLDDEPFTPGPEEQGDNTDMAATIAAWETAGGSPAYSIPVIFSS